MNAGRVLRVEQVEHLADRLHASCCRSGRSPFATRRFMLNVRLTGAAAAVPSSRSCRSPFTRAVPSSSTPSNGERLVPAGRCCAPFRIRCRDPRVDARPAARSGTRKTGADRTAALRTWPDRRRRDPWCRAVRPAGRPELRRRIVVESARPPAMLLDVELVRGCANRALCLCQCVTRREVDTAQHATLDAQDERRVLALAATHRRPRPDGVR